MSLSTSSGILRDAALLTDHQVRSDGRGSGSRRRDGVETEYHVGVVGVVATSALVVALVATTLGGSTPGASPSPIAQASRSAPGATPSPSDLASPSASAEPTPTAEPSPTALPTRSSSRRR